MSWSMIEPDEPPICECKYDEARDEMDHEDCPFHCDVVEDSAQQEADLVERKKPSLTGVNEQEDAA